eukprot:jgi/Botrbrau1/13885/Bobra.0056s0116.1
MLDDRFEDRNDLECSVDTAMDPTVPLHVEFYLTQVRPEDQATKANIIPRAQPFVKFGRPDLPNLMERMRKYAVSAGEKRVAVLSCGPAVMVDELRQLCWDESDNEVAFDFHGEVFEF